MDDQAKYPKTTDFGSNDGGYNILNVPDDKYKSPDQFWREVNKPFLDEAIKRNDPIRLATKPADSVLNKTLEDGSIVRTGFGREFDYLLENEYEFDSSSSAMIRN
ncbi:MAG: hypothetical protein IPL47_03215 [Phyllobacteriaceae bacterium]|nr:hypothetical protein [Phyllobacteriaceae bacterium]